MTASRSATNCGQAIGGLGPGVELDAATARPPLARRRCATGARRPRRAVGEELAALVDARGADLEVGADRSDRALRVLERLAGLGHRTALAPSAASSASSAGSSLGELADPRLLRGSVARPARRGGPRAPRARPGPLRHRASSRRTASARLRRARLVVVSCARPTPARHAGPRRAACGRPRRRAGRHRGLGALAVRVVASSSAAPVAPEPAAPTRQPVTPNRSPARVTTTAVGCSAATRSAAPSRRRRRPRPTGARRAPGRHRRPHRATTTPSAAHALAAHRLTGRRRRPGGAARHAAEGEHGTAVVALGERPEGPTGGVDVGDDDRGERLAGGGLERPPPSRRRPRPGRAACRARRRGRPGARRRPAGGPRRARGRAPRPGPTTPSARPRPRSRPAPRRRARLGRRDACDRRPRRRRATSVGLGRLGLGRARSRRSALGGQSLDPLGERRVRRRLQAGPVVAGPLDRRAQGGELAADLGGLHRSAPRPRRPTPPRSGGAARPGRPRPPASSSASDEDRLGRRARPRAARPRSWAGSASSDATTAARPTQLRSRSTPRRRSASSAARPRPFSRSDSNRTSASPTSSPPMADSCASVAITCGVELGERRPQLAGPCRAARVWALAPVSSWARSRASSRPAT